MLWQSSGHFTPNVRNLRNISNNSFKQGFEKMNQSEIIKEILKLDAELLKRHVEEKQIYDQLYSLMRQLRQLATKEAKL